MLLPITRYIIHVIPIYIDYTKLKTNIIVSYPTPVSVEYFGINCLRIALHYHLLNDKQ